MISTLATGLAFPEGPVLLDDGGVLVSEMARGCLTRVDASGTRVVVQVGGGPNGLLRWGPHILVCQNGGSSWGTGPWPYDLPGAAQLFRPTGPAEQPVPPQVQRFDGQGDVVTFATTFPTNLS